MSHTPHFNPHGATDDVFMEPSPSIYEGAPGSLRPSHGHGTPSRPDATGQSTQGAEAHWHQMAEVVSELQGQVRALTSQLAQQAQATEQRPLVSPTENKGYRSAKLPPPKKFYGWRKNTIEVTNWLFSTLKWCRDSNYDPATWVSLATNQLDGPASTWYRTAEHLHPTGTPWQALVAAMHAEFDDELSQDKLLDRLFSLSQQTTKNRSVTSYTEDFRRTMVELGSVLTPEVTLHTYINGLLPRTQVDVRRANPATVDEAMLQAARASTINDRTWTRGSLYDPYYETRRNTNSTNNHGDPMDLSQIYEGEESDNDLKGLPEDPQDLWQLAEQDPDHFTEIVDDLHAIAMNRGQLGNRRGSRGRGGVFRGRFRKNNFTGRSSSYGTGGRDDNFRGRLECYVCGKEHLASECPDNYRNKKRQGKVLQIADTTEDSSGNGKGQGC
jgi:hypothetical protein